MKDVSTIAKGDAQSAVVGRTGIGLVFNGGFVQGVATNRTLGK